MYKRYLQQFHCKMFACNLMCPLTPLELLIQVDLEFPADLHLSFDTDTFVMITQIENGKKQR